MPDSRGLDPAIHVAFGNRKDIHVSGEGWVYMMSNRPNGTLYTGVTNDLVRRAFEHKEGIIDGFTKRYRLTRLVYFERH